MESKYSKNKKKHKKELESFRNRMGSNLVWFNSLSTSKQYDILFLWKIEKWREKNNKRPKFIFVRRTKIKNPLKLKYWIKSWKYSMRFSSSRTNIRNSVIDIILKNKNNT